MHSVRDIKTQKISTEKRINHYLSSAYEVIYEMKLKIADTKHVNIYDIRGFRERPFDIYGYGQKNWQKEKFASEIVSKKKFVSYQ